MPAQADNFAPALAVKLINQFGVSATITTSTPNFDEIEGESINLTQADQAVTLSPPTGNTKEFQPTTTQEQSASISYMKGNESFEPKNGQRVTLSGVVWSIIRIDTLRSGDQVAAYRLWLTA